MKRGPKPFKFGDSCRRGHQLMPTTVVFDGGKMRCKLCRRINKADSYKSNPEVRRSAIERARRWYSEHIDRAKETRRSYYYANRAKASAYSKKWKIENPEKVRKYWERNRDALFAKWRAYGKEQVRSLGDGYVLQLIAKETMVPRDLVPRSLIEAKRVYLRDYYRPTMAFKKFLRKEIEGG